MISRIAMAARVQRERAALTISMLCFSSLVILLLVSPMPGRAAGEGTMLGDQTGDTDRGKQLFQETLYRPPLPGSGQGGSPATECLWPNGRQHFHLQVFGRFEIRARDVG